jgi:type IV secretory pathway TraG/TraD family ATPase VirD4
VFIQYSDERDENYDIIELFMMDLYSRLVKVAEGKNGRLNWPFYFVWDEFGNFPAVPRFSNMMTACRSRNMWLILVLQDYAQLDSIYGAQNAAAIRNNANIRMFYGTNDVSTMHAFSAECLNNTQLSPLCALNGIGEKVENFNFETVPLVTVSDLNIIEEGVCYVKCFRKNPMKSWFERSYNCPEFNYKKMSDNETQSIKLSDPKYTFKIITQKRKSRFDF